MNTMNTHVNDMLTRTVARNFRRPKNRKPRFDIHAVLRHRTWLERQVDEAVWKRNWRLER